VNPIGFRAKVAYAARMGRVFCCRQQPWVWVVHQKKAKQIPAARIGTNDAQKISVHASAPADPHQCAVARLQSPNLS
jgi:hypothetical protein